MIQAAAVSTPEPGFFATLKSLLFSGGSVTGPRMRRAPDEAERAELFAIRQRVGTIDEGHEAYTDAELVGYVDRNIVDPLRWMMRTAAADWAEPHLGQLATMLRESDGALASFDEKLTDRGDLIGGLDELHFALGNLARGHV